MSIPLNLQSGEIYVDSALTLRNNITPEELVAMGVKFNREIDMKTGWILRTMGPCSVFLRAANFSLAFLGENLKRASFAFADPANKNLNELYNLHNQVLFNALGEPHSQLNHMVSYSYPWGAIVSELDPRSDSCNVTISWK
ncbi:hypothetical protein [Massilia sp. CF038]|uniref:hypothetical protein n=1 Tax=Massilia sp. CF038 TaxID=1881045 RepID=UPI00091DF851|nr:hypothetical protein [Massilia sp. CF038]SHH63118.1 hypothetical protein SAMN05428948_4720 [Massilia sp. CF038]